MKIHFFTKGDKTVPSSRYRAFYIAEKLKSMGYKVDIQVIEERGVRAFFRYFRLFYSFKKDEYVFLQRTIYNKWFSLAVFVMRLFFNRRFVFDIDDAVFEHSPVKTRLFVKLADKVICGSRFILRWAQKYNKNVYYFLNGVPLNLYLPFTKKHSKKARPVIGWVGSGPAHYENLKLLEPIFRQLLKDGVSFSFKLVGAVGDERIYTLFKNIKGLEVEIIDAVDWSNPCNTAKEIQTFDIGVMPLTKNNWSKAKYFKTLEYMACAVPPVVPGFGENTYIVEDNKNGMVAGNRGGWVEKLTLLLHNVELRGKLGETAQGDIKNKFSTKSRAKQLVKILTNETQ